MRSHKPVSDCVFCKIVAGFEPARIIWQSKIFLAFLSNRPNTNGFAVVIPKRHYDADMWDKSCNLVCGTMLAVQQTALVLKKAYDCRIAAIVEGMGVNHLHVKLAPMHGTDPNEWRQTLSTINQYFERYPGYVASNGCDKCSIEELDAEYQKILAANSK